MNPEIEYEVEVRQELVHTVRVKATTINNARREAVRKVDSWTADAIDLNDPTLVDLCTPSMMVMSVHEVCPTDNG